MLVAVSQQCKEGTPTHIQVVRQIEDLQVVGAAGPVETKSTGTKPEEDNHKQRGTVAQRSGSATIQTETGDSKG